MIFRGRNTFNKQWEHKSILMFIARLHSDYRIPYKAVVKRLYALEFIDKAQYEALYKENNREKNGLYYTLGTSIGEKEFQDLNSYTKTLGVYKNEIESFVFLIKNPHQIITLDANFMGVFLKLLKKIKHKLPVSTF